MTGLAEVLRDHLWADRPGQTCGCGWEADSHWLLDRDDPNHRVEQWLAHVAAAVTAWLAERLGSDEVRKAAAAAVHNHVCGHDNCVPDDDDRADADAALAAVVGALAGES